MLPQPVGEELYDAHSGVFYFAVLVTQVTNTADGSLMLPQPVGEELFSLS
jgi:hypothetical protein